MNILGEDLKSVLQEIGETCEVYNHTSQLIHTDYIDFKRFWGTRIPFENEFQVLASFSYDSPTIPGDRLKILSDNTVYVVSNTTSEYFENEIITKESFMYKCNGIFQLKRKSDEMVRDDNFELIPQWDVIVEKEYALFTGTLEHQHNMVDEIYARFQDKKRKLIISSHLDVQIGDKVLIFPWLTDLALADFTAGAYETWQVELVEGHRLQGIKMCNVGEFSGV